MLRICASCWGYAPNPPLASSKQLRTNSTSASLSSASPARISASAQTPQYTPFMRRCAVMWYARLWSRFCSSFFTKATCFSTNSDIVEARGRPCASLCHHGKRRCTRSLARRARRSGRVSRRRIRRKKKRLCQKGAKQRRARQRSRCQTRPNRMQERISSTRCALTRTRPRPPRRCPPSGRPGPHMLPLRRSSRRATRPPKGPSSTRRSSSRSSS